MAHELLTIRLDLSEIESILQQGLVKPHVWRGTDGREHQEITLFCKPLKTEREKQTHFVTMKSQNEWKDLTDAKGNRVYVGSAIAKIYNEQK